MDRMHDDRDFGEVSCHAPEDSRLALMGMHDIGPDLAKHGHELKKPGYVQKRGHFPYHHRSPPHPNLRPEQFKLLRVGVPGDQVDFMTRGYLSVAGIRSVLARPSTDEPGRNVAHAHMSRLPMNNAAIFAVTRSVRSQPQFSA